ncbi:MAG: hypothetical protein WCP31_08695 [Chloroflexales bacterium]
MLETGVLRENLDAGIQIIAWDEPGSGIGILRLIGSGATKLVQTDLQRSKRKRGSNAQPN